MSNKKKRKLKVEKAICTKKSGREKGDEIIGKASDKKKKKGKEMRGAFRRYSVTARLTPPIETGIEEGVEYSSVACLSHSIIDQASLSRRIYFLLDIESPRHHLGAPCVSRGGYSRHAPVILPGPGIALPATICSCGCTCGSSV